MSNSGNEAISQEEAEELLLEAVDNIAEVQDNYADLHPDSHDMLREAKSGIGSVYIHLGEEVVIDL